MKKAFTLIEILIVVILLGILAAVVVPQFLDQSEGVKQGACKTDISTLNSAWQQYVATTLAKSGTPILGTDYATAAGQLLTDGYLDKVPVAPTDYTYAFTPGASAQLGKFSATGPNSFAFPD